MQYAIAGATMVQSTKRRLNLFQQLPQKICAPYTIQVIESQVTVGNRDDVTDGMEHVLCCKSLVRVENTTRCYKNRL